MMAEMENSDKQNGSGDNNEAEEGGQDGVPLIFLKESALFGQRRPMPNEWLKHEELYKSIGNVIDISHILGLQRVNGLWRIYLDNLEDKVALMTQGVPLRGRTIPVLRTNPYRADSEITTRVRVKNVPLSADDNQITRVLTLRAIDVISVYREKLRIDGKLTNCATGDRIFIIKSATLKEPLPRFMEFGRFKGRVIHPGQVSGDKSANNRTVKCSKCLEDGHRFSQCENDWTCRACHKSGHKESECTHQEIPTEDPSSSDSSSTESDSEPEESVVDTHSSATCVEEPQTKEHEEPRGRADETAGTPVRRRKKHNKTMAKQGGQTILTDFMTKGDGSDLTPDKGRHAPPGERSPPTPAELLRDNAKKAKS